DRVRGNWIDCADDEDPVGRVALLTASADLERGDLHLAQVRDDDARAVSRIDDRAAVIVRSNLDVTRRVVGAELDGALEHASCFQEELIFRGEGLHCHAIQRAPCFLLGRAIGIVVASWADVVFVTGADGRRPGQRCSYTCGEKNNWISSSHNWNFHLLRMAMYW